MKHFLLPALIFFFSDCLANDRNIFGAKLGPNLNYIAVKNHPVTYSSFKEKWGPGGQAGIFYSFRFTPSWGIGTEILYNVINSREVAETAATDEFGNPSGQIIRSETSKSLSYLSLPLYLTYKLSRFNISMGWQFSLLTASSGRSEISYEKDGVMHRFKENYSSLNVEQFDHGPRAGITYQMNKTWGLELSYYHGIPDILKIVTYSDWQWKNRQLNLAFRYHIFPSK